MAQLIGALSHIPKKVSGLVLSQLGWVQEATDWCLSHMHASLSLSLALSKTYPQVRTYKHLYNYTSEGSKMHELTESKSTYVSVIEYINFQLFFIMESWWRKQFMNNLRWQKLDTVIFHLPEVKWLRQRAWKRNRVPGKSRNIIINFRKIIH